MSVHPRAHQARSPDSVQWLPLKVLGWVLIAIALFLVSLLNKVFQSAAAGGSITPIGFMGYVFIVLTVVSLVLGLWLVLRKTGP
jgi:hypothetical protein